MTLDDLLSDFAKRSGLGRLSRDAGGICTLVFDDVFSVDIEARESQLILSSVVGAADDLEEETMRAILSANLFGNGTGGGVLAIDDVDDTLVLWREASLADLHSENFQHLLEEFLASLQTWRQALDEADNLAQSDADRTLVSRSDDGVPLIRL